MTPTVFADRLGVLREILTNRRPDTSVEVPHNSPISHPRCLPKVLVQRNWLCPYGTGLAPRPIRVARRHATEPLVN
jgi:hypothetical protein